MSQADTETEILNVALIKLGAATVLSIHDDVKAAREARHLWPLLRDAEIGAHNWNFSTKRTTLARLDLDPPWGNDGFQNGYEAPSDMITLIEVGPRQPGVRLDDYATTTPMADWRHEGDQIWTNINPPLKIRYTARIEATGLWDSNFKVAFACQLAAQLCEALTQSNPKGQAARADYMAAIKRAIQTNAIENPPDPPPSDTWVLSRFFR